MTLQSGFMANLATIPALVGPEDVIFSDELNHASIIDACRLSRAVVVRYGHNDMDDLQRRIAATQSYRRRLIIDDGIVPGMDGDVAPLDRLCDIAEEHGIILMVDGFAWRRRAWQGVGRASWITLACMAVYVEIGTLSKAFGVVGGLVAGRKTIVDWLRLGAWPPSCSQVP
ncbi:MAG: aminotransferase class I/II-fold pyridoxal phosphate-dependent enzyme [Caldilineaceae bacterium]